jgi:hypothetical protein
VERSDTHHFVAAGLSSFKYVGATDQSTVEAMRWASQELNQSCELFWHETDQLARSYDVRCSG